MVFRRKEAMTALTRHGGRLDHAALLYPEAPRPWIDLSTGINPVAWQPSSPPPLDWGPLPSPAALAELEAGAADFFGAPASAVVAVPGTEIALRLLARLGLPAPFRYVAPGYGTHAHAFPGAMPIAIGEVPSSPGGTLLLANPNNPDGRILDRAFLHALAADRRLIVDEAFADFDPALGIVSSLPPGTIVLRGFGKFFGLAGLRLGFVIAPAGIVRNVRAMLGDWPVSTAAIAFGAAAYRDAAWIAATRSRLVEEAHKLDAVLRRHGLEPGGACPLFRLVEGAPSRFERLARAGILTRPFADAPGRLRIGLPPGPEALARLDRALGDG